MQTNIMMLGKQLRKGIIVFCMGLFAISCVEENKPPIAMDKMKQILFDIQVAEAYSSFVETDINKKNKDTLALYYAQVFDHHKIDQATFENAMDWYLSHPDSAKKLYNKIVDTATHFKTSFAKAKPIKVAVDSSLAIDTAGLSGLSGPFRRPNIIEGKSNIHEPQSTPVNKEDLENIKKQSKAKQEALNKVKNEN